MSSWKSENRKHKVRSDAKYDTKTASIVIRLLAAGFTFEDAGYAIGVRETTIQSWVQRYPVFKKQIEKVKEAVKAITYAQLLRAAWGYDFEEVKEEYNIPKKEDGTLDEEHPILTSKVVTIKHQVPNGDLLKFILLNRDRQNWQDVKNIDIRSQNTNLELAGNAEADEIASIAGSLIKKIESKEIDKSRDINSIPTDDTKNTCGEPSISGESSQGISKG